jgi:hypothetical protein
LPPGLTLERVGVHRAGAAKIFGRQPAVLVEYFGVSDRDVVDPLAVAGPAGGEAVVAQALAIEFDRVDAKAMALSRARTGLAGVSNSLRSCLAGLTRIEPRAGSLLKFWMFSEVRKRCSSAALIHSARQSPTSSRPTRKVAGADQLEGAPWASQIRTRQAARLREASGLPA